MECEASQRSPASSVAPRRGIKSKESARIVGSA
jgi:hypothetical protein